MAIKVVGHCKCERDRRGQNKENLNISTTEEARTEWYRYQMPLKVAGKV